MMKPKPESRTNARTSQDAAFMLKVVILAVLIYIAIIVAAAQAHAAPLADNAPTVPPAADKAPVANPPAIPPIVVVRVDGPVEGIAIGG
jgi:hypothetical protein